MRGVSCICGGLDRKDVHVKHKTHQKCCPEKGMSLYPKRIPTGLAVKGLSPFRIVSKLRLETNDVVLYNNVYNVWACHIGS